MFSMRYFDDILTFEQSLVTFLVWVALVVSFYGITLSTRLLWSMWRAWRRRVHTEST